MLMEVNQLLMDNNSKIKLLLTLTSGTGYTVGTTTAVTGTINNDDFSQLSINNVTVVEGQDSNVTLTVMGQIAFLPVLILSARLCPVGIEASLFALLMLCNVLFLLLIVH